MVEFTFLTHFSHHQSFPHSPSSSSLLFSSSHLPTTTPSSSFAHHFLPFLAYFSYSQAFLRSPFRLNFLFPSSHLTATLLLHVPSLPTQYQLSIHSPSCLLLKFHYSLLFPSSPLPEIYLPLQFHIHVYLSDLFLSLFPSHFRSPFPSSLVFPSSHSAVTFLCHLPSLPK